MTEYGKTGWCAGFTSPPSDVGVSQKSAPATPTEGAIPEVASDPTFVEGQEKPPTTTGGWRNPDVDD